MRYASSFTPSPTLGASRDLPLARPQSSVRGPRRAGLENTGFALANADMLWIDPLDYRDDLAGVDVLATAGVAVSVYNLPRCVLARSTWPFAAQSISDWKNGYLEQCDRCVERPRCSGFFTIGRPRHRRAIAPILAAASSLACTRRRQFLLHADAVSRELRFCAPRLVLMPIDNPASGSPRSNAVNCSFRDYSKCACAAYAALPTVEQTREQGTRDLSRKPHRLTGNRIWPVGVESAQS